MICTYIQEDSVHPLDEFAEGLLSIFVIIQGAHCLHKKFNEWLEQVSLDISEVFTGYTVGKCNVK